MLLFTGVNGGIRSTTDQAQQFAVEVQPIQLAVNMIPVQLTGIGVNSAVVSLQLDRLKRPCNSKPLLCLLNSIFSEMFATLRVSLKRL